MIVRRVSDVLGTERDVHAPNWVSRRLLLKRDGMGFSLHETIIHAGTETSMWYRHHLEAVFCVEGEGEVETLADGAIHSITPGTLYALDRHDKHVLRARTDMRLVCVFNPPLTGAEVHDEEGVYPITEEAAAG
ncbi:ectoine synthase [Pelomicrobium sp. G1]|uniref:ectoine synthase n=1 Tax=unclassified Pelomicrobium TaxID=2815318 RepID=UPI003F764354